MTKNEDREYLSRLLKAGAFGYLLKKAVRSDLTSALEALGREKLCLNASIAAEVVGGYLSGNPQSDRKTHYEKPSYREKQVLKLIAEGYRHKKMADILSTTVKTVIAHRTNVGEKLGVRMRTGLIKFAIQKGMIKRGA